MSLLSSRASAPPPHALCLVRHCCVTRSRRIKHVRAITKLRILTFSSPLCSHEHSRVRSASNPVAKRREAGERKGARAPPETMPCLRTRGQERGSAVAVLFARAVRAPISRAPSTSAFCLQAAWLQRHNALVMVREQVFSRICSCCVIALCPGTAREHSKAAANCCAAAVALLASV